MNELLGTLTVLVTTNFMGVSFTPIPCTHPACAEGHHSFLATERYMVVRDTWAEVVGTGENRRLHSDTNDWGSLKHPVAHPSVYHMHTQPGWAVRPGTRWPLDMPPLPPWGASDASKAPRQDSTNMPPGWKLQTDGNEWRWVDAKGGSWMPLQTRQRAIENAWEHYNYKTPKWKDAQASLPSDMTASATNSLPPWEAVSRSREGVLRAPHGQSGYASVLLGDFGLHTFPLIVRRSNTATLPSDSGTDIQSRKLLLQGGPPDFKREPYRHPYDTNHYGVLYNIASPSNAAMHELVLEKRSTDRGSGVRVWEGDGVVRYTNPPTSHVLGHVAAKRAKQDEWILSHKNGPVTEWTNVAGAKLRHDKSATNSIIMPMQRFQAIPATNALPRSRRFAP